MRAPRIVASLMVSILMGSPGSAGRARAQPSPDPGDVASRARALLDEGRQTEALALLDDALAAAPSGLVEVRFLRGCALMGSDPARALADLDHVIERDARHVKALLARATLRGGMPFGHGDAGALADLEQLLAAAPDHVEALYAYGELLLHLGRCADADAALGRVVERGEGLWLQLALRLRVLVRHRLGRFDDALADHARVISPTETSAADSLVLRARLHEARGDFDQARADLSRALELGPLRERDARFALGRILAFQGDIERARAQLALAIDDNTPGGDTPEALFPALVLAGLKGEVDLSRFESSLEGCPELSVLALWRGATTVDEVVLELSRSPRERWPDRDPPWRPEQDAAHRRRAVCRAHACAGLRAEHLGDLASARREYDAAAAAGAHAEPENAWAVHRARQLAR